MRLNRPVRPLLLAAVAAAVTVLAAPAAQASFPGTNGLIAFIRNTGTKPGIYVIAPNGTHLRRLVPLAKHHLWDPVWSPDGSHVAYYSTVANYADNRSSTDVVAAAGGSPRVLATGRNAGQPSWTPDGLVSWAVADPANQDLICIQAYGEAKPRLCTDPLADGSWSSTGRYAGVSTTELGVNREKNELEIVSASGAQTAVTQVAPIGVDWSPNGSEFVATTKQKYGAISVIPAATGVKNLLPIVGWYPAWSPNGKKIVFMDTKGIAIVNADGTHLVQLTHDTGDGQPSWGTFTG